MFDYMIASFAPDFTAEICDLILTPPEEIPYNILKETLIKRTAASDQRHLQQLFSAKLLGDWKPTEVLYRLEQLVVILPGLMELSFESCLYNAYQLTSEWFWR